MKKDEIKALEKKINLDAEKIASLLKNQEEKMCHMRHQNALMITILENAKKCKEILRKDTRRKEKQLQEYKLTNEET